MCVYVSIQRASLAYIFSFFFMHSYDTVTAFHWCRGGYTICSRMNSTTFPGFESSRKSWTFPQLKSHIMFKYIVSILHNIVLHVTPRPVVVPLLCIASNISDVCIWGVEIVTWLQLKTFFLISRRQWTSAITYFEGLFRNQTLSTGLRHPSSNHCHNWLRHRSRKTVSLRTGFRSCSNRVKFVTGNSNCQAFLL